MVSHNEGGGGLGGRRGGVPSDTAREGGVPRMVEGMSAPPVIQSLA